MPKASITKRVVDTATPATSEYVIWDDGGKDTVKGFGLKVTPAGSKVYIYQYRLARPGKAASTSPRKYTIGKHGEFTPDQARSRAKELAIQVAQGTDPRQLELDHHAAEEKTRELAAERLRLEGELAFSNLAARWLEEYAIDHRPTSVGQAKVSLNKYLLPILGHTPIPKITRAHLQRAIDAIPATQKATRHQVYAYTSILFRWAMERGYIEFTPVVGMSKPKVPKSRERVLSDSELAVVWRATYALPGPFGALYRLLVLTGQRRSEVARMRWSELDQKAGTWRLPGDRAKNSKWHQVPLSTLAQEELDRLAMRLPPSEGTPESHITWPESGPVLTTRGQIPISGFSKAKSALDTTIAEYCTNGSGKVAHWTVHDLRRTLATGLQGLGVRIEVTSAILNHTSGTMGGVSGIYHRYKWDAEKREALDTWAQHVLQLANRIGEMGSR